MAQRKKTISVFSLTISIVAAALLPATTALAGRDVRITYAEQNGTVKTSDFDLLVVACDPGALTHVFDGKTALEETVEAKLERYTLGTSLWDVQRKEGGGNEYTIRMSPDHLSAGDGHGESIQCVSLLTVVLLSRRLLDHRNLHLHTHSKYVYIYVYMEYIWVHVS